MTGEEGSIIVYAVLGGRRVGRELAQEAFPAGVTFRCVRGIYQPDFAAFPPFGAVAAQKDRASVGSAAVP